MTRITLVALVAATAVLVECLTILLPEGNWLALIGLMLSANVVVGLIVDPTIGDTK